MVFSTVCLRQCYKNKPWETACEGKSANEKGQVRMATMLLADRKMEVGERKKKKKNSCMSCCSKGVHTKTVALPNAVHANFILNGISILS